MRRPSGASDLDPGDLDLSSFAAELDRMQKAADDQSHLLTEQTTTSSSELHEVQRRLLGERKKNLSFRAEHVLPKFLSHLITRQQNLRIVS